MTSLSLAIVAATAVALVVAYMRRPRMMRRLRLGSARFLADLSPASRSRLTLAPLLQSRLFFIRMLFLAAVAAALLLAVNSNPVPGARLGLRIVVDTTASMGIAAQDAGGAATTRAAQGAARIAALLRDKEAQAREQHYQLCTRILAVDRDTRTVLPGDLETAVAPRPLGGDPRMLADVALGEDAGCPPTHAVVVTDRRKPAIPAARDGRSVLWWQVGQPVTNAAIEAVAVHADPLAAGPVTVSFAVRHYGAAALPRQAAVTGPDGAGVPLSAAGCTGEAGVLCFEATTPGRYTIALSGADAFAGDDRAVVEVPRIKALAVDWRLPDIPPPPALHVDGSPDAILVARAEDRPDVGSRRAVLVGGRWLPGPGGSKLGFFNPDDPLLESVNVDLIEQAAPAAFPAPAGFVRAAAVNDRDVVARRAGPRAALVPPPLLRPDAAAPLRNASLLLFANALRYVSAAETPPPAVSFIDADGNELPDVRFESDTAEDGDRSDLGAAIVPRHGDGDGAPLWPWLVVLALVIFAAERALSLPWRTA